MSNFTYFKSKNVIAFPCINRGFYTTKEGVNVQFNCESRLNTERNLIMPGTLSNKKSYFISHEIETPDSNDHTKAVYRNKFVIGGYYFEVLATESELNPECNTDVYLVIKTASKTILDNKTHTGAEAQNTSWLVNLDSDGSNGSPVLDIKSTVDNQTDYYFKGLGLTGTKPTSSNYICLKLCANNKNKYNVVDSNKVENSGGTLGSSNGAWDTCVKKEVPISEQFITKQLIVDDYNEKDKTPSVVEVDVISKQNIIALRNRNNDTLEKESEVGTSGIYTKCTTSSIEGLTDEDKKWQGLITQTHKDKQPNKAQTITIANNKSNVELKAKEEIKVKLKDSEEDTVVISTADSKSIVDFKDNHLHNINTIENTSNEQLKLVKTALKITSGSDTDCTEIQNTKLIINQKSSDNKQHSWQIENAELVKKIEANQYFKVNSNGEIKAAKSIELYADSISNSAKLLSIDGNVSDSTHFDTHGRRLTVSESSLINKIHTYSVETCGQDSSCYTIPSTKAVKDLIRFKNNSTSNECVINPGKLNITYDSNNNLTRFNTWSTDDNFTDASTKIELGRDQIRLSVNESNYIDLYEIVNNNIAEDNIKINSPNLTIKSPNLTIDSASLKVNNSNVYFNNSTDNNTEFYYTGKNNQQYSMIRFLNNHDNEDKYGQGISIGGGGLTIVGSGESASLFESEHKNKEDLYLTSDANIYLVTNCNVNAGSNKKIITLDTEGNFSGTAKSVQVRPISTANELGTLDSGVFSYYNSSGAALYIGNDIRGQAINLPIYSKGVFCGYPGLSAGDAAIFAADPYDGVYVTYKNNGSLTGARRLATAAGDLGGYKIRVGSSGATGYITFIKG